MTFVNSGLAVFSLYANVSPVTGGCLFSAGTSQCKNGVVFIS